MKQDEACCIIWSEEHGAWWRPDRMGYTTSIRQAGRYTPEQADDIVKNANLGREISADWAFNEVALIDPL